MCSNTMRVGVFLLLSALGPSLDAAQTPPGPPPQPWQKTCGFGTSGNEGCTVTITMTISPNTPCNGGGGEEYCVKIKIECPAGNPPGDPFESCESTDCEVCAADGPNRSVRITCDGQCFSVAPKQDKTWGDGANDCGNLRVASNGNPCT